MLSAIRQSACLVAMGVIMALGPVFSSGEVVTEFSAQRQAMLESVARDVARHGGSLGADCLSPDVARALETVPRHRFVPARFQSQAYGNHPLPIGHGQTISQPTIVAVMTELLAVGPADTVLEVGTGSGYQAAILGEIVAQVHTIEIVPGLARSAADLLAAMGYRNITVHTGDGYAGLPDQAPFDAVLVTAAPPELPATLLEQLKPGGRLVVPVGPEGGTQWLTLWTKHDDGSCRKRVIMPVRFVPMVSRSTP